MYVLKQKGLLGLFLLFMFIGQHYYIIYITYTKELLKMSAYRGKLLNEVDADLSLDTLNKSTWCEICKNYFLSEEFIIEFQDEIDWHIIIVYQNLSENFIVSFQDKIDWEFLSIFQKLSEKFIRKFQDKVKWNSISANQKLTGPFIIEFENKMIWNIYFCHQKADFLIMKKFILKSNLKNMNNFETEHLSTTQKQQIQRLLDTKYVLT